MKKKLASLLALAMALSLIAGCGSGSDESRGPRDSVNLALPTSISTIDPHGTAAIADVTLLYQVYDSLYFVNDDGSEEPRLASDYTRSQDGKVYKFVLREDAYFHNGDQVTAADVVFSINRAKDMPAMATILEPIENVAKLDEKTVEITLKKAYMPFFGNLSTVMILNQELVEREGDSFGSKASQAGAGPYRITDYNANVEIRLEAFPDYYRGQAPIQYVSFKPISDTTTGLTNFESGELDLYSVPTSNWAAIEGGGKYETRLQPTSHITYVLLNPMANDALKNDKIREAIFYAIDKEAMNLGCYEGLAKTADYMAAPEYIKCAPSYETGYEYNPEKAMAILQEAGYPDGVSIGTINTPPGGYYEKACQILQSQLAAVGISCDIDIVEQAVSVSSTLAGNFDLTVFGFNFVRDYAYGQLYLSPDSGSSPVKFTDEDGWDRTFIISSYDEGAQCTDDEQRTEIYKKLDEYMNECHFCIPLFHKQAPYAWDKNLNVVLGLNDYYVYDWSWK